jgi:hypothetical protein
MKPNILLLCDEAVTTGAVWKAMRCWEAEGGLEKWAVGEKAS